MRFSKNHQPSALKNQTSRNGVSTAPVHSAAPVGQAMDDVVQHTEADIDKHQAAFRDLVPALAEAQQRTAEMTPH
jgi:hypothetical protein